MDLGLNDDTRRITPVTWMNSATSSCLYLWVGSAPISISLQKSLESGKPLSDEALDDIETIFGNNYRKSVKQWVHDAQKVVVIRESIYPDDTVLVTKLKCLQYIPLLLKEAPTLHHLYIWAREEVTPDRLRTIAMFPSPKYIYDNARKVLNGKIDIPEVPPSNEMEALEWLYEQTSKHRIHFMEMAKELEYIDRKNRTVYIIANPYDKRAIEKTISNPEFVSHDRNMISTSPMLFITSARELAEHSGEHANTYFPRLKTASAVPTKAEVQSTIAKLDAMQAGNEIVSNVIEHPMEDILNTVRESVYRVERLYVEVSWIPGPSRANLKTAFQQLQTSGDMPCIEYKDSNENLFKLRKKNMTIGDPQEVQQSNLQDWTQDTAKIDTTKVIQAKLIARLFFGTIENQNRFFTVVINENGKVHIKYKQLGLALDVSLERVIKSFEKINKLFENLEDVWAAPNVFPRVNLNIFTLDCPPTIRIIEWATSVSMTLNKTICDIHKAEKWLSTMFPFVDSVVHTEKQKITMRYTRVQNYHSTEAMESFLKRNRDIPQDQLRMHLMKQFMLDASEANMLLEDRLLSSKEKEKEVYNRLKKEAIVIMELYNDSRFRITIKGGLRDILTVDRIMKLVLMGWTCTSNKFNSKPKLNTREWNALLQETQVLKIRAPLEGDGEGEEGEREEDEDVDESGDSEDRGDNDDAFEVDFDIGEWDAEGTDSAVIIESDSEGEEEEEKAEEKPKAKAKGKSKEAPVEENQVKYRKEILKRLQNADRDLFSYKWTSSCGAENRRQPIVLTRAQKERIDKDFPGSYGGPDNFVKAGTTPERLENNYYVCPKIWCPHAEVTMTREQYEAHGQKCPGPSFEQPLFLDGDYWTVKGEEVDHYPKLHDYGHPKGFKQPCCGKRKDVPTVETSDNRYILRQDEIPVSEKRFGALPDSMGVFFQSGSCSGSISDKKQCYVRMGIKQGPDALFECIVRLLDNPDIPSVAALKDTIQRNMTVFEFIKLNQGNLVKTFFDQNILLQDTDNLAEFKKWFANKKQNDYVELFGLKSIRAALSDMKKFTFEGYDTTTVGILREYMIYNAYTNFMKYVASDIPKEVDLFYDMFNRKYPWLNRAGLNLLVFSVESDTGVYVACPRYVASKYVLDLTQPFIVLIKHSSDSGVLAYEPIVRVVFHKGAFQKTVQFSYFDNPFIRQIASYFSNNCVSPSMNDAWKIVRKVISTLQVQGDFIRDLVIDMSFKLRGVVLANSLYVPFPIPSMIPNIKHSFIRYIDQVDKLMPSMTVAQVKAFFKELSISVGDPYYTDYKILTDSKGENDIGLQFSDDQCVPINLGKYASVMRPIDTRVFIMSSTTLFPDQESLLAYPEYIGRVCRMILASREAMRKIRIIKHVMNPLPWSIRERQLREWITTWMPELSSWEYLDMLLEDLVTKDIYRILGESQKTMRYMDSELVLNRQDIRRGRLLDIYMRIRNPFVSVESSIEDYIQYVVPPSFKSDEQPRIHLEEPVSIKPERWNILLKRDYHLLNLKKSADSNKSYVLDIFSYLSKLLDKDISREKMVSYLINKGQMRFNMNPFAAVHWLMDNTSFRRMVSRRTSVDDVVKRGWPGIRDMLLSNEYVYGEKDVLELAQLFEVDVIMLTRQHPVKSIFGFNYFSNHNEATTLLLHIEHGALFDIIRPVGRKADSQFIFSLQSLPNQFLDFILSNNPSAISNAEADADAESK